MAKQPTAKAIEAQQDKVQPGEKAVRLNQEISGGLGNQPEGKVLRHLSPSAYNTLVQGGLGEALEEGADASDAVDTSAPLGDFAGTGSSDND